MTTSRLGLNRVVLLKSLSSYVLKRIWKGLAGARPRRESHMAQSASMRQSASTRQSASKDSSWVSNRALARYIHLSPIQSSSLVTLAFMDLDPEEPNPDDAEPQLDQETPDPHEDPADTPTQTLWDQAESNDKFALQILKTLCSEACHHNRIPLTECEEH